MINTVINKNGMHGYVTKGFKAQVHPKLTGRATRCAYLPPHCLLNGTAHNLTDTSDQQLPHTERPSNIKRCMIRHHSRYIRISLTLLKKPRCTAVLLCQWSTGGHRNRVQRYLKDVAVSGALPSKRMREMCTRSPHFHLTYISNKPHIHPYCASVISHLDS